MTSPLEPPPVPLVTDGSPVVTMGPVAAGVVRVGGQTGLAALILQGLQLFHVTHLTGDQATWLVTVLGGVVALVVNRVEARKGRRLVGSGTYP